jgi:hypothetical protein
MAASELASMLRHGHVVEKVSTARHEVIEECPDFYRRSRPAFSADNHRPMVFL